MLAALDPCRRAAADQSATLRRRRGARRAARATSKPPRAAEGSLLHVVRDPDQRLAVAALSQRADDIENLNPAYRAELRAWTTTTRTRRDGVPHLAVPHVDGSSEDEVPIRDFDTHGAGVAARARRTPPATSASSWSAPTATHPADWLRAGEALERVLLEITRHGFVASPLTQVTEVPSARAQLRRELGLVALPARPAADRPRRRHSGARAAGGWSTC